MTSAVLAAAIISAASISAPAGSGIQLNVPVIRQSPERCGPAAVSMVLRFYGAAPEALARVDRAYNPAIRGALITDLAKATRAAGYPCKIESPSEDSLATLLHLGVPPVLLYTRGEGPVARKHYGVVVGREGESYTLNDGGPRSTVMKREELMRRWKAAGGWALIIRRPRS